MILAYEDTFEGLLTALFAYYTKKDIKIISSSTLPGLVNASYLVGEPKKAEKFASAIIKKFGTQAYENIYFAYIYNAIDKESSIINYIDYLLNKNDSCNDLFKIIKYRKKIVNTINRYQGFLRFADIGGILYSKYSPEYDISWVLGKYFEQRLSGSCFIIHDLKRDIMLFNKNKEQIIIQNGNNLIIGCDDYENNIQKLFKTYFKHASIKERENYKLQRSMFPLKLRKYSLEFDEG